MRRVALGLVALFGGLIAVLIGNTLMFAHPERPVTPVQVDIDEDAAAQHLAEAIRFPTVSGQGRDTAGDAFGELLSWMIVTFPRVHQTLSRDVVNRYTVIYTWPGSDPSLEPILLMAHTDVVPVAPNDLDAWTHPPFSGAEADGYIWGRGAQDDKQNVIGLLDAIEGLLAQGFQPKRTVVLLFGHDEEIGGTHGAKAVAERFAIQGKHFWMVLDEGGSILDGVIEEVERPVAVVGVAEKGYVTLKLTAGGKGGHSSMPPKHTAVGKLAAAITRIEANPLPASLDGPSGLLFAHVGPHMPFPKRLIFANRWLFDPVVLRILSAKPKTNATVRTTAAATMFRGSPKENVLPTEAVAMVNFRIVPGDTVQSVHKAIRGIVDDPDIRVEVAGDIVSEPSPVSPVDAEPFRMLDTTIREVFPGTIVAPYLVVGATDARHLTGVAEHVYRFSAMKMTSRDLERIHGIDERASRDSQAGIVRFYTRLIQNTSG